MAVLIDGWSAMLLAAPSGTETAASLMLPCGHRVLAPLRWFDSRRKFSGRLGCTESGCRRIFEDVVLGEEAPRG